MSQIVRAYGPATANPVASGSTVIAEHINTDLDTIYADHNGGITDYNISAGGINNVSIGASANIAISKTALGTYTAWTTWVPVFYKNDATTNAGATIRYARYKQVEKTVTLQFYADTITNTANPTVWMSLPVNAVVDGGGFDKMLGSLWAIQSGGDSAAVAVISASSSTKMAFYSDVTQTNWASGANAITLWGTVSYEVA